MLEGRPTGDRARGITEKIGRELRQKILRPQGPAPGEVFARRYRLGRMIGEGGMGQVFRAVEEPDGRTVAVKILRGPAERGPAPDSGREQFERRLGLLRQLEHPGLVRTYDVGEAEGVAYVVTEFLEGETLKERIRRKSPVAPAEAVRLLVPVLRALEYLHGRGIVHRDVKPQNIMLTRHGVKLLDYGLARRLGIPGPWWSGGVEGTAEYLAPEQVRGDTEDHRVDLYAAAAVLYEMLAGRPPFLEGTPSGTALAHVTEPLTFPPEVQARTPPALLEVVAQGMCRDPELRYGSAREMCSALTGSLTASSDGGKHLRRLLQRDQASVRAAQLRERLLPWAAAVGLALIGVAAWWGLARSQVAGVGVEGRELVLRNVLGSELMRVTTGLEVVDVELLRREDPALIAVAGVGGSVVAYEIDPSERRATVVWTQPSPGELPMKPASLHLARLPDGDACLVSRWTEAEGGRGGLVASDFGGNVLGEWSYPGVALTTIHVEGTRPDRPRHLLVGGRSDTLGGRAVVIRLSLPDLAPTQWALLDDTGEVVSIRVSGQDVTTMLSSGRRQRLTGLAGDSEPGVLEHLDPRWLTAVQSGDDPQVLTRLARNPAVPPNLLEAIEEAVAGMRLGERSDSVPQQE